MSRRKPKNGECVGCLDLSDCSMWGHGVQYCAGRRVNNASLVDDMVKAIKAVLSDGIGGSDVLAFRDLVSRYDSGER